MHHLIACGLDNVWLANGYRYGESPYGETVSIADVDDLYKVIALTLVAKADALAGPDIRFLRKQMDMSQESLGDSCGSALGTPRPCSSISSRLVA